MEEYKFLNPNVLISNYGRASFLKGKQMKKYTTFGSITPDGYLQIKTQGKSYRVHRLVWQLFNGEIPDGYHIHHIDGNPQNNHFDNLSLISSSEHSILHNTGRQVSEKTKEKIRLANSGKKLTEEQKLKIRENSTKRKKVNQYDLQGNFIKTWESNRQIERETGIPSSNISVCCNGKVKYTHGFIFKYVE